jgi:methyl-accepting chemotaxis protein
VLEANHEALPDPVNEEYTDALSENSLTGSIERPYSDSNHEDLSRRLNGLAENLSRTQENVSRRLDGMAENLSRSQDNVSRRLDVMVESISKLTRLTENYNSSTVQNTEVIENISKLTQNLSRLTEKYDNSTVQNTENITKMKTNFVRLYGKHNGFE